MAPTFVDSFRIAAPYIHKHRGKTFVVLVGGEAVRSSRLAPLMHDVALLHGLGARVVLVHGTRPQIAKRLDIKGLPARFENEVRVTDRAALECVHEAVGAARARVDSALSMGTTNSPMAYARIRVTGGNYVTARPIGVRDGVDYLFTGEVRRVDTDAIVHGLDGGAIVLVSPLGHSPTGESFNLSSHDVACEVAIALQADKLVCLVEGRGVLDGRRRLIQQLTPVQADALLLKKQRRGADQRKHLAAAARAVRGGVRRAHLVDRRRDGALIEEIFTREGIGTLITRERYEDLRPARMEDVGALAMLLQPLEEEGLLIRRSRERIEMEIDRFVVIDRDGLVIGCAALEPFVEDGTGEMYCVAIHPQYRDGGRGEVLLRWVEERALAEGLSRLFVLTTRSAHFFGERGFEPATVRQLPKARRASYDRSRRSRVMIKTLSGS